MARLLSLLLLALLLGGCLRSTDTANSSSQATTSSVTSTQAQQSSRERPEQQVNLGICGAPATPIHQVQGTGNRSPLIGDTLTVEGIVVGDFQSGDGDRFGTNLGGYFVQEEDHDADGDPRTSEGIYVADSRTDVRLGDLVRVTGTVLESGFITQIGRPSDVVICESDQTLPSPAVVEFPLESVDALEAYEGMLVTFPQELVISEYFNYDRFGEIVLAWPGVDGQRVYQPTHEFAFDDRRAEQAMADMPLIRITLDDGITDQNPSISRHPDGGLFSANHGFRGGDVLKDLTGVLDYRFDTYRVQPVMGAEYIEANPRPEAPDEVGGSVRAAAFNVLNYFGHTTNQGNVCGPTGTVECRGADNAAEQQRQWAKIVNALHALDAHVVGLMEIENDADHAAVAELVTGLNGAAGIGTYAYVDSGGPVGNDAIKVALIYQPAVLTPIGAPAVLSTDAFLDPVGSGQERNRAALAQTFEDARGGRFTIVVNHLKSKGSACGERPEGGLQGNCNQTRTLAVQELLRWLGSDPTSSGDPDFLVVGDLNSYAKEEPTLTLLAGPDGVPGTEDDYTDLLAEFVGEDAYTFVFDGMAGYLDYAVSSSTLTPQVTGATAWHINADEPDILDYDMSFKKAPQTAFYAPDPYRSSDHDPVLVGLELTPSRDR